MVTMVETMTRPSRTTTAVTKWPNVAGAIGFAHEAITGMRRWASAGRPMHETCWHVRDEAGDLLAFAYVDDEGAWCVVAGEAHWSPRRSEA